MTSSRLYLTVNRPDIMFKCMFMCYQSSPKESHLKAVRSILRYIKGIIDFGLCYPREISFNLKGYSNDSFAGCLPIEKHKQNVIFQNHALSHGLVRSKTRLLCQRRKPNIYLLGVVVTKFFG